MKHLYQSKYLYYELIDERAVKTEQSGTNIDFQRHIQKVKNIAITDGTMKAVTKHTSGPRFQSGPSSTKVKQKSLNFA